KKKTRNMKGEVKGRKLQDVPHFADIPLKRIYPKRDNYPQKSPVRGIRSTSKQRPVSVCH
ncbi:MAG TPA: hypothetical protein V6C72_03130, partial [Chroococcales cyanobacterium]